jgi:transcriptional regulator with XRE-family HTH domain
VSEEGGNVVISENGLAFTLAFMGEHTPGSRLRQLRERLGISLRKAAQRSESITYGAIRSLETRDGSWDHVELGTLVALSRAYGIPIDRLVRFVFLTDDAPDLASEILKGPEDLEVHPDWVAFPAFAASDAGDEGAATPEKEMVAYIPIEHLIRRGVLRENVRVFHLDGRCLVSDEVKRVEKAFAPGDYVAIDTTRQPEGGEVVMAWCETTKSALFKRWLIDEGDVTFHPLSGIKGSMTVYGTCTSRLLGPVVWRGG